MKNFTSALQQRLQLDINYFASSTFYSILQQIVGVSSGLIVSYLFGHFVSKTHFGEYNLVLSILGSITFLSLPGVDLGLTQSIVKGYDYSLIDSHKRKFRFSLVAIPALLILSYYYITQNNAQVGKLLILCAFWYPFLNAYTNFSTFLAAKHKFKQLAMIASTSSLFFLTSIFVSTYFFNSSLALTLGYLIGITFPTIAGYFYSTRFVHNRKFDPQLSGYGLFLTLISIIPWISAFIGSILLGTLRSVELLATFVVASRFFTAFQKNFGVLYKPLSAKIAAQSAREHTFTLLTHGLKLIFMGIALCIGLYLTSPLLITFFFGSQYKEAIIYSQWLSLALIPQPLMLALNDMVIFQKDKKTQILTSTVPQIIKIILYLLLIPRWNISGLIIVILLERFTEPLIPLYAILRQRHKS